VGEWVPGPAAADFNGASSTDLEAIWPRPEPAKRAADFSDPLTFERVIFLKQNAAWLLEQELRRLGPALQAQEIALGTATDPYQPIERRTQITRSLLEVFARRQGYRLSIVTKSDLITRDIDLLVEIARRNTLVVHITITTPDVQLARKLEPRAPRPDLRFAAVRRLRQAGITAGILCCPLLPGITDSEAAIDDMARRAAQAGASFFAANPLFLKACSRPTYLSFVREHFSSLLRDTEKRFALRDFAAPGYAQALARIVARACAKYGLGRRSRDTVPARDTTFDRTRPAAHRPAIRPAVRPSARRTTLVGPASFKTGSGPARKPPESAAAAECSQAALFA
jgi:DNA repair photolyase